MNDAIELLRQLERDRFYGAVTFKLEAGHITTIKKEQTLKPTDLSGHPRSENATGKNE